jgi:hypothetical protein
MLQRLRLPSGPHAVSVCPVSALLISRHSMVWPGSSLLLCSSVKPEIAVLTHLTLELGTSFSLWLLLKYMCKATRV